MCKNQFLSSLSSKVLKFRTHQEEKTYDDPVILRRKRICLLNTDLRSVSKAALRKLWHSNKEILECAHRGAAIFVE